MESNTTVNSEDDSTSVELSKSEEQKKLGNDAFAAKKYDEAIIHYSEAIKLEPDNAVFYSNRSACYASKGLWQKAVDDASTCIEKDTKFVKGYYRLATAFAELGRFEDAELTLETAMKIEPDNELIVRHLKTIRSKKVAAASALTMKEAKRKAPKKLNESQIKEMQELQEEASSYSRDLRGVTNRLVSLGRDSRSNQVTESQIVSLPADVPLYRSVGKAFVLSSQANIQEHLDNERGTITKNQRDLQDRKEYLERRLQSTTQNMRDLYSN